MNQNVLHIQEGILIEMQGGGIARLCRGQVATIFTGGKVPSDVTVYRKASQLYVTDPDLSGKANWLTLAGQQEMILAHEGANSDEQAAPSFMAQTRIGPDSPTFGAFRRQTKSGRDPASWRGLKMGEARNEQGLIRPTTDGAVLVPYLGMMEEGNDQYDIVTGKMGRFYPILPCTAGLPEAMDPKAVEVLREKVAELVADGRDIAIGWVAANSPEARDLVRANSFTPRRAIGVRDGAQDHAEALRQSLVERLARDLDSPHLVPAVMDDENDWEPEVEAWAGTPDGRAALTSFMEEWVDVEIRACLAVENPVWELPGGYNNLAGFERMLWDRVTLPVH